MYSAHKLQDPNAATAGSIESVPVLSIEADDEDDEAACQRPKHVDSVLKSFCSSLTGVMFPCDKPCTTVSQFHAALVTNNVADEDNEDMMLNEDQEEGFDDLTEEEAMMLFSPSLDDFDGDSMASKAQLMQQLAQRKRKSCEPRLSHPPKPSTPACSPTTIRSKCAAALGFRKRACHSWTMVQSVATGLCMIPDEVLLSVLTHLGPKDICSFATVSKRFNTLGRSDWVWKQLCVQRWGCERDRDETVSWREHYACLYAIEAGWANDNLPVVHEALMAPPAENSSSSIPTPDDVSIFRVASSHNALITLSSRGVVRVWDVNTLQLQSTLYSPPDAANTPTRLTTGDGLVAVGTTQGDILVFDLTSRELIKQCRSQQQRHLWGLLFLPCGDLMVCHGQSTVCRWQPRTGTIVQVLNFATTDQRDADPVFNVLWRSGQYYTAHASGVIHVWSAVDGTLVRSLRGHSSTCTRLCLSGGNLISSSFDGMLRMWCCDTGACLDVANVGYPIVGMCAGECGFDSVVISTLDRCTRTKCGGVQIWATGSQSLKRIRVITHHASKKNSASPSCWFDGMRIMFTRENDLDADAAGQLAIVSLDHCPPHPRSMRASFLKE